MTRAGVAGGALGTMLATASSAPAVADSKPTAAETAELPAVPVSATLAAGVEQSTDATQTAALRLELGAERQRAAEQALEAAEKARKAKEAEEAAERAERAREQAASRSAERTGLSAPASGSGSVGSVIGFLRAQVGKAYVMGASGPSAYDCSGLTQAAFRTVGVELPRTSQAQSTAGTPVPVSAVQPGDLVFWGGAGSAYHVGVYIGDGKYLDAANSAKGVVVQEMSSYMPDAAARVL